MPESDKLLPRVLIAESGSGFGGTAKYLSDLLPYMKEHFRMTVAAAGNGPLIRGIRSEDAEVFLKPAWRFPWGETRLRKNPDRWTRLLEALLGALQLAVMTPVIALWLKRQKIRLVHLNNEIFSHLPLVYAAKFAGIPCLCHLHGWRELTRIEKRAARQIDRFVAVTHAGAALYSQQLGGRNVEGIPNGLSDVSLELVSEDVREQTRNHYGYSELHFVIGLIGRMIPLKGHEIFIKAVNELKDPYPNLRCLIVGNTETGYEGYERHIKQLVNDLGLEERFIFAGWQEKLANIYAACDLVVQPSVEAESFGLVPLEAMAQGKPVIASRLGGLVDVVDNDLTGYLVEPGNEHELAEAIRKVACDSHLRFHLGLSAGRTARQDFRLVTNAAKVAAIYKELLSGRI